MTLIALGKVALLLLLLVCGTALLIWAAVRGTQGVLWCASGLFRGIGFVFGQLGRLVRDTFGDAARVLGSCLTAAVLLPLALMNLLFLRWDQARHFGAALEDELIACGLGTYRLAIGNPLRFICLDGVTDGIEQRLPDVVARAPRARRAEVKDGKFDGYKVTGVLPAGGSGARLFLATPRPQKLKELLAAGYSDPGQVVIKAFHLASGSTMPQIVRESRALDSARQIGFVLEHELTESSFFYVMPYVPGDDLDQVISSLHDSATPAGLGNRQLRVCLGYAGDLLYTLDAFHAGGLWHKDIKPSNLIISSGRAHLVDLGLVTPLESAMTLTTHGTEYYRDPEMVRLALRGVKVHEVNGVKFDIYSTGALIYSMIENSFPAQGSLSQISKRCPEAVSWIVRRAMSDLDARYGSAQEMLADIRAVLAARDPFAVRPADLPSLKGDSDWQVKRASFAGGQAARGRDGRGRGSGTLHRRTPVTAVKARRRSMSRSLAAAMVGALFLAGGSSLALMAGFRVGYESAPDQVAVPQLRAFSPLARVSSQAARAASATQAREKRLTAVQVAWSRELALDFAAEAKHGLASEGQQPSVLVLQDLRPTSDPLLVAGLRSELKRRGLDVVGVPEDGIGDERDILYEASARKSLGLASQDDAEAALILERFLEDHQSIDAVFWIASGEDDHSLNYRVVVPRRASSPTPSTFSLAASGPSSTD
ncbi:MAG TPA: hypothetical protein EYG30_07300 [Planctomycetes bacterium]|nr:hypothetical protein [Planctomycetota bacterium]HIL52045.1 hypothetical protein [Planctomycetota bacterium]